jgi:hypothetical protein
MAHSSDVKINTVHSRANRLCLNCKKYFVPKNDLPAYVEGKTAQIWCNKVCYAALYPPVIKEIQCLYCPTLFIPRVKRQVTCGSKECKRKRVKEYAKKQYEENPKYREKERERQKKRYKEDSDYREKMNKYARKQYAENPEYRENSKERNKKERKNPEYIEKQKEYKRKLRKDPEYKKKRNEKHKKQMENPEFKERYEEYQRKYRLKNKEEAQ